MLQNLGAFLKWNLSWVRQQVKKPIGLVLSKIFGAGCCNQRTKNFPIPKQHGTAAKMTTKPNTSHVILQSTICIKKGELDRAGNVVALKSSDSIHRKYHYWLLVYLWYLVWNHNGIIKALVLQVTMPSTVSHNFCPIARKPKMQAFDWGAAKELPIMWITSNSQLQSLRMIVIF